MTGTMALTGTLVRRGSGQPVVADSIGRPQPGHALLIGVVAERRELPPTRRPAQQHPLPHGDATEAVHHRQREDPGGGQQVVQLGGHGVIVPDRPRPADPVGSRIVAKALRRSRRCGRPQAGARRTAPGPIRPTTSAAGVQVVPGRAPDDQAHRLAAVPVRELDRRSGRVGQVAVAPLLQRDQHRVQLQTLVGEPVLVPLPLAGYPVRLAAQDSVVDQRRSRSVSTCRGIAVRTVMSSNRRMPWNTSRNTISDQRSPMTSRLPLDRAVVDGPQQGLRGGHALIVELPGSTCQTQLECAKLSS